MSRTDSIHASESYWISELHKERNYVQPIPDYETKDILVDEWCYVKDIRIDFNA